MSFGALAAIYLAAGTAFIAWLQRRVGRQSNTNRVNYEDHPDVYVFTWVATALLWPVATGFMLIVIVRTVWQTLRK